MSTHFAEGGESSNRSDLTHLHEIEKALPTGSDLHTTTFIDEAAFFLTRGFRPVVLPPERPSGWPRFTFPVTPEFVTAQDEWSSAKTALVDVHEYNSARKRLYGATDLYRRGAK